MPAGEPEAPRRRGRARRPLRPARRLEHARHLSPGASAQAVAGRVLRARRRVSPAVEGHALADGPRVRALRLPRRQHQLPARAEASVPGGDRGHLRGVSLARRAHARARRRSESRRGRRRVGGRQPDHRAHARGVPAAPEAWAREVYDCGLVPRAAMPFCAMLEVSRPERFSERRRAAALGRRNAARRLGVVPPWPSARSRAPTTELADPLRVLEDAAGVPHESRAFPARRCRRSSRRSARAIPCSMTRAASKRRSRALDVPVRSALLPGRDSCVSRDGLGPSCAPLLARCARVPRSPHAVARA